MIDYLPQIIYVSIMVYSLVEEADKHGQEKAPSKHNFFLKIIACAIVVALLKWGGFFENV